MQVWPDAQLFAIHLLGWSRPTDVTVSFSKYYLAKNLIIFTDYELKLGEMEA